MARPPVVDLVAACAPVEREGVFEPSNFVKTFTYNLVRYAHSSPLHPTPPPKPSPHHPITPSPTLPCKGSFTAPRRHRRHHRRCRRHHRRCRRRCRRRRSHRTADRFAIAFMASHTISTPPPHHHHTITSHSAAPLPPLTTLSPLPPPTHPPSPPPACTAAMLTCLTQTRFKSAKVCPSP